jgi:hypothetical protein
MSPAPRRANQLLQSPLPSVRRGLLVVAFALLAGLFCAVETVVLAGAHIGTLAALPVGLLTFILVSAVALVVAARVDAAISAIWPRT